MCDIYLHSPKILTTFIINIIREKKNISNNTKVKLQVRTIESKSFKQNFRMF